MNQELTLESFLKEIGLHKTVLRTENQLLIRINFELSDELSKQRDFVEKTLQEVGAGGLAFLHFFNNIDCFVLQFKFPDMLWRKYLFDIANSEQKINQQEQYFEDCLSKLNELCSENHANLLKQEYNEFAGICYRAKTVLNTNKRLKEKIHELKYGVFG